MERNHSHSQRSELSPRSATIVSPPLTAAEREDRHPSPWPLNMERRKVSDEHIARLFNDEQQAEAIRRRLARAEHIDIDALYAAEALKLTGKVLWIIGPTAILLLVAGLTVTFA